MYYRAKRSELSAEITGVEKYLNDVNKNLLDDLCNQSMIVLKDKLARKYEKNKKGQPFALITFVSSAAMVAFFF